MSSKNNKLNSEQARGLQSSLQWLNGARRCSALLYGLQCSHTATITIATKDGSSNFKVSNNQEGYQRILEALSHIILEAKKYIKKHYNVALD